MPLDLCNGDRHGTIALPRCRFGQTFYSKCCVMTAGSRPGGSGTPPLAQLETSLRALRREQAHHFIEFPEVAANRRGPGRGEETIPLKFAQLSTALLGGRPLTTIRRLVVPGAENGRERDRRTEGLELTIGLKVRPHASCIWFSRLRRAPNRKVIHGQLMNLVLHAIQHKVRGL